MSGITRRSRMAARSNWRGALENLCADAATPTFSGAPRQFDRAAIRDLLVMPAMFSILGKSAALLVLAGLATSIAAPGKLTLPNTETFTVEGQPAFIFLPPAAKRASPQPWIFYAPTLPGYPDEADSRVWRRAGGK